MNKAHRDRIAFMRICSGKFDASHGGLPCAGREEDETSPAPADDGRMTAMIVDEAYAGDIIGVFDPGYFLHR